MKDFRKLALMLTFLENAISQKRFLFLIRSSQISISLENLLLNGEMQNYSLKGTRSDYLTQNQNVDSYVNITVRASYKLSR